MVCSRKWFRARHRALLRVNRPLCGAGCHLCIIDNFTPAARLFRKMTARGRPSRPPGPL